MLGWSWVKPPKRVAILTRHLSSHAATSAVSSDINLQHFTVWAKEYWRYVHKSLDLYLPDVAYSDLPNARLEGHWNEPDIALDSFCLFWSMANRQLRSCSLGFTILTYSHSMHGQLSLGFDHVLGTRTLYIASIKSRTKWFASLTQKELWYTQSP